MLMYTCVVLFVFCHQLFLATDNFLYSNIIILLWLCTTTCPYIHNIPPRVLTLTMYHYVSLHSQCTSQNVRSVFVHWTCGHDEESLTLTDATRRTSGLRSSTELADAMKNHWHSLTRLTERPVCVRPLNLRTPWRITDTHWHDSQNVQSVFVHWTRGRGEDSR
jgi:hypothetical protein